MFFSTPCPPEQRWHPGEGSRGMMEGMIPTGTAESNETMFCGQLDGECEMYRRRLYQLGIVGVKHCERPQGDVEKKCDIRAALCPMPDEFMAMHLTLTKISQHFWHPLLSTLQTALAAATAVCLTEGVGFLEKSHRWCELADINIPEDLVGVDLNPMQWAFAPPEKELNGCTAFVAMKNVAEAYNTIAQYHPNRAVASSRAEIFAAAITEASGRAIVEHGRLALAAFEKAVNEPVGRRRERERSLSPSPHRPSRKWVRGISSSRTCPIGTPRPPPGPPPWAAPPPISSEYKYPWSLVAAADPDRMERNALA